VQAAKIFSAGLPLCVLLGAASTHALAEDPCAGFKWDVSKERALFSSSVPTEEAGKDGTSAPVVVPNRLYLLQLKPRVQVVFAAVPGKTTPIEGTYAGLAVLKIPRSGGYRIAVDLPLWIDVAAGGQRVPATNYQGQQFCDAPHKIVQFDLSDSQPLLLQFSGATKSTVRLTVTRVES